MQGKRANPTQATNKLQLIHYYIHYKMDRYLEKVWSTLYGSEEKPEKKKEESLGSKVKSVIHYPGSVHCGLKDSSGQLTPVGDELEEACLKHDTQYGETEGAYTTFIPADAELMDVAKRTWRKHPLKSSIVYATFAGKKLITKHGSVPSNMDMEEKTRWDQVSQIGHYMDLDVDIYDDPMEEDAPVQLKLARAPHVVTKLDMRGARVLKRERYLAGQRGLGLRPIDSIV